MKNKFLLPVLFFAASTFQSPAQKIVGSASGSTQTVIASPRIKTTNVRFLKQQSAKRENTLSSDELFSIAPNPVTSKTVLKNEVGLFVNQITVTDIHGKTLSQSKVESSGLGYSVNCSSLASGTYFLAVEFTDSNKNEKTQTIKFTKQ